MVQLIDARLVWTPSTHVKVGHGGVVIQSSISMSVFSESPWVKELGWEWWRKALLTSSLLARVHTPTWVLLDSTHSARHLLQRLGACRTKGRLEPVVELLRHALGNGESLKMAFPFLADSRQWRLCRLLMPKGSHFLFLFLREMTFKF